MAQLLETIFKPEAKTVREIFDGGSYFQVPDYQRPYSWEDEQIEQLWDDLYSAFQNDDPSYFLGPVILSRTNQGYNEIIDGQQRLTALTILFCVLRDLYFSNDNKILNRVKSLEENRYRLRLITQLNYQNQFEQEILNQVKFPKEKPVAKGKERLFLNTAWIYRQKLNEIGTIDTIERFVNYILNNVVLITITCSNLASAIKLFQVLNTRGLDLSNSDLIKSHLYSRLNDDLQRSKFISTWNQVETIARQTGESLENLFTYYEYYLLGRVPKRTLYLELEDQFRGKDPNTVIYEFKKFVEHYYDVCELQSKEAFSLRYLPNQVFWKSILISAMMVDFPAFDELIKVIRRLYYAYWVAGYTTAKVRQLSFNIISMLKQGKALNEIKNEIDEKMGMDRVIQRVQESLDGDAYENRWLKPLLVVLEYEQTDDSKIIHIELDRNLHVDHILPKKWAFINYWKNMWNEKDAIQWLNKIGNLALLSGRKNISASNRPFEEKKKSYDGKGLDGKTAFLTSQVVAQKIDWTLKEVRERQSWVTEQINRILDLRVIAQA